MDKGVTTTDQRPGAALGGNGFKFTVFCSHGNGPNWTKFLPGPFWWPRLEIDLNCDKVQIEAADFGVYSIWGLDT